MAFFLVIIFSIGIISLYMMLAPKPDERKSFQKRNEEYLSRSIPGLSEKVCKRAAILHDLISTHSGNIGEAERQISTSYTAFNQKESDWAVVGGISSAVGGPVAGAAAALKAEANNAAVRRYNATTAKDLGELSRTLAQSSINRESGIISRFQKQLDQCKTLRTLNKTTEELFANLQINEAYLKKRDGSRVVSVYARLSIKEPIVKNNVKYCIDGALTAIVSRKNTELFKVIVPLPLEGIDSIERLVCGHHSINLESLNNCKITFEPLKLYAIEAMDSIWGNLVDNVEIDKNTKGVAFRDALDTEILCSSEWSTIWSSPRGVLLCTMGKKITWGSGDYSVYTISGKPISEHEGFADVNNVGEFGDPYVYGNGFYFGLKDYNGNIVLENRFQNYSGSFNSRDTMEFYPEKDYRHGIKVDKYGHIVK